MRILEINKFLYPKRGAERHFLDVVALLRAQGHEVATFGMRHPNNPVSAWNRLEVSYVGYNQDDSTLWQKLKGMRLWSFEARKKITLFLKEFQPEVVHLHNIYHQLSPSIFGPIKKSGAKIILTVHDYHLISPDKDAYYETVGAQYWRFLFIQKYSFFKRILLVFRAYFDRWGGWYLHDVDVYIAPSEFVKQVLIHGGIDGEKIVVVPHFVTASESLQSRNSSLAMTDSQKTNTRDEEQESEKENKKEMHALYFGTVSEEKNISQLTMIFEYLRVKLILAGNLERGFQIQKSKYVEYAGMKNKSELTRLIQDAACVVSASQLAETFGLVILEANAQGKPFFGFRTGAFPELIESDVNGILAGNFTELADNLQKFFQGEYTFDEQKIQQLVRVKYSSEAYYRNFTTLLKERVSIDLDKK